MNVVDSSGWVEYLSDGANADFFAAPIADLENLLTPTICLYEVFKRVLITINEEKALEAVGSMSSGQVVNLNRDLAVVAAQLSVELKLAMADSIILATARAHNAILWTQDAHFQGLDGVRYVEKPQT